MLIDRVYWINNGYQIFGSQAGVDLADKKTRTEVAKKYGVRGYPSYVMEKVANGQVGSPQPVNERSYDGLLNILKNAAN